MIERPDEIEHLALLQDRFNNVNQLKMWYKIHACDELRRKKELSSGCEYDLVVRVRPDLSASSVDAVPLAMILREPDLISTSYLLPEGVGDQLFVAQSRAMSLAVSVWPFIKGRASSSYFPSQTESWAEILFMQHLGGMGLSICPKLIVKDFTLQSSYENISQSVAIAFLEDLASLDASIGHNFDLAHEIARLMVARFLSADEVQALFPPIYGVPYLALRERALAEGDSDSEVRYEHEATKQRTFLLHKTN